MNRIIVVSCQLRLVYVGPKLVLNFILHGEQNCLRFSSLVIPSTPFSPSNLLWNKSIVWKICIILVENSTESLIICYLSFVSPTQRHLPRITRPYNYLYSILHYRYSHQNIMTCRPGSRQRPRNKQLYNSRC
jgi:hypothetical protein